MPLVDASAPADYPPPVDSQGEFIKRGLDDEDELIEVGVAIVGGGTAGLAAANRLLQLLADDEELREPDRAGQAGRPAAHDGHAGGDLIVLGVPRRPDELAGRVDGRRVVDRSDAHPQPPFRAFSAAVSLGRILFRSPTTPRSENSKIGAFGSLLIATMFSEDCMPTLCWIAPEMPAAR